MSVIPWTERPPVRFQVSNMVVKAHAGVSGWIPSSGHEGGIQWKFLSLPSSLKKTQKNEQVLFAHLKRHRMNLNAEAILYRMSSFNHTKGREAKDYTPQRSGKKGQGD